MADTDRLTDRDIRFIADEPGSGTWNMAADQVLMEAAEKSNTVQLRFYAWSEPTMSLGYFQTGDALVSWSPLRKIGWVRRATGGGAIVHHHDLTYSLAVPDSPNQRGVNLELYQTMHRAIRLTFQKLGVDMQKYADTSERTSSRASCKPADRICVDPWLCFQRRSAEDLLTHGYKVVGSAQRRSRAALLQHGSVLLATSGYAPELPGILELTGKEVTFQQLSRILLEEVTIVLGKEVHEEPWQKCERLQIAEWEQQRFATAEWTKKR